MNTQLEQLHSVLLEILDFIYSVCEENHLLCFLVYGTALGAYRHHGFIPWDDDMDVAMPREDYMKFLQIMKESGHDKYEIQDENNEDFYFLSFAKVRKKNTVFIEQIVGDVYTHKGIFVDVFPLDYVKNPETSVFKIRRGCIIYFKHILRFQAYRELYKNRESKKDYILDNILSLPGKFLQKPILRLLNKLKAGKISRKEASYIAEYDTAGPVQIVPYDIYFPPRKIEFEGKQYNVPNKIEEYLIYIYGGGYMQLPPPEHRVSWKASKIEF